MHNNKESSSVRVIGGVLRGRKIIFSNADDLRPTLDRVRETVFNWLMPFIQDATCLDLFAGTGALGIEALSRGAKEVVLIEKNKFLANDLRKNIHSFMLDEKAKILNVEFNTELTIPNKCFDIVFLDPPFNSNILTDTLNWLIIKKLIHQDSLIYIEHGINLKPVIPESFAFYKSKKTTTVFYGILQLK
jgi:16S rRNA (guanine966-N2)-methyltransferase